MKRFIAFRDKYAPVGQALIVRVDDYRSPDARMAWDFVYESRVDFETPELGFSELVKACPEILEDCRLMEELILQGVI